MSEQEYCKSCGIVSNDLIEPNEGGVKSPLCRDCARKKIWDYDEKYE